MSKLICDKEVLNEYNCFVNDFNNKLSELEAKYPNVKTDLMWNYDHSKEGKRRISINKIFYNIYEREFHNPDMIEQLKKWENSSIRIEKK